MFVVSVVGLLGSVSVASPPSGQGQNRCEGWDTFRMALSSRRAWGTVMADLAQGVAAQTTSAPAPRG